MPKALLTALALSLAATAAAQPTDYPIQGVSFTKVKLTDTFWLPRLETNTDVTIPASFARCESTNRVKNFEMAAAKSGKFATTYPFDDTDIYKTIEGASYSLSLYPDPKLAAYVEELIAKVEAAQEPDGYLYTARTIDPAHPHAWAGQERWEKERELSHELYNAAMPSDSYTFATPSATAITLKINGKPLAYTVKNGYAVLARKWHKNDVVDLTLPLEVRQVLANPHVKDDLGKVALQRGPLMFCAEWKDNDFKTSSLLVPASITFTATYKPDVLNGVVELTAAVPTVEVDAAGTSIRTVTKPMTAIAYYAWANRGKGEMNAWFPQRIMDVDIISQPTAEATAPK